MIATKNTTNAIGYCRVSTDEQGVSLADQREKINTYAKMLSLNLIETIVDEGVSGTVPMSKRDGGQKLLDMLSNGSAGHVIAIRLDRLFRSNLDALTCVSAWDRVGVALSLIDFGGQTLNTSTATGRMMLSMMAAFAQFERDLISERTSAALQHKRRNGDAYTRDVLGYDKANGRMVANANEQKIVADIHRWRRKGLSMDKIAKRLNAAGVVGKRNGRFYASTVKAILDNDIHAIDAA